MKILFDSYAIEDGIAFKHYQQEFKSACKADTQKGRYEAANAFWSVVELTGCDFIVNDDTDQYLEQNYEMIWPEVKKSRNIQMLDTIVKLANGSHKADGTTTAGGYQVATADGSHIADGSVMAGGGPVLDIGVLSSSGADLLVTANYNWLSQLDSEERKTILTATEALELLK